MTADILRGQIKYVNTKKVKMKTSLFGTLSRSVHSSSQFYILKL